MKNFKLLLATTALLSTTALMANADPLSLSHSATNVPVTSNNIIMGAFVDVVSPITATIKAELMFPMLLADEGGNTVTVTTAGEVANDATATILNRSTGFSSSPVGAGEIEFTGPFAGAISGGKLTEAKLTNLDNFVLPSSITLKNLHDADVTCGQITSFSKAATYADGKVTLKIGGTYQTADLSSMSVAGMRCAGDVSVTFVLADEQP